MNHSRYSSNPLPYDLSESRQPPSERKWPHSGLHRWLNAFCFRVDIASPCISSQLHMWHGSPTHRQVWGGPPRGPDLGPGPSTNSGHQGHNESLRWPPALVFSGVSIGGRSHSMVSHGVLLRFKDSSSSHCCIENWALHFWHSCGACHLPFLKWGMAVGACLGGAPLHRVLPQVRLAVPPQRHLGKSLGAFLLAGCRNATLLYPCCTPVNRFINGFWLLPK